jgi:RNA polymerase sigma-70 factor, ECF subfamily
VDEQQLIEAAKRDPARFGLLYDRYFEPIFRFIYRRTDDENLADDLTSQTFLQAMLHLHRYEIREVPFSAWLYKIALNELNKHFRTAKARPVFSLEESVIEELMEENGSSFSEESLSELIVLLEQLSADEVSVLQLRFFEEKSFKEIAFILDIGESGAKMRLYRSLEKLKKHFSQKTGS